MGSALGVALWIGVAAAPAHAYPPVPEACAREAWGTTFTDRGGLELNGPVTRCVVKQHAVLGRKEVFHFDSAGRIVEHLQEDRLGHPESRERHVYDAAGRRVETLAYRWHADALPDTGLVRHSRYRYEDGRILEERIGGRAGDPVRVVHACDGGDVVRSSTMADGSLVEERWAMERDDAGRIVETRRTVGGRLIERQVVTHDPPWRERTTYRDGVRVAHGSERLDEAGRVREIVDHRLDGSQAPWRRLRFDASGRLTDGIEYDASGNVRSESTFTYGDDAYGNWIRRIEMLDGVQWVTFRAIEYAE